MSQNSDNVHLFFRQLGEMLASGIGLVPALDVLARDEGLDMAKVAKSLAHKIEAGMALSAALKTEKQKFPTTVVVLLQIGERTGRLAESLLQATAWLKQDRDLVRHVKSTMTYPLLVLLVAGLLTFVMFTTVVPRLLEVVVELGADLPLPTKIVSLVCGVLKEPFFYLVALALAGLAGAALSHPEARAAVTVRALRTLLLLPVIGPTLTAYFFVRFCNGLAVLVENGVNVLEAVGLAQRLSGHPGLLADEIPFRRRVQEGESLAQAMESRPDLYPSLVIAFTRLGEEAASLAKSLERVGSFLGIVLQERLHAFRQALEPILTLAVGGLVALVLLATLLPLYSVVAKLGP